MSAYTAEFIGTLLLVLLGDGVVAGVVLKGTKSENAGWMTIVVGWGIAVTIAVYAVGGVSGAHLNPAITLALAFKGTFPASDIFPYIAAQFGGAFVGAILVWLHYGPHWKSTQDTGLKLAVFCTAPAVRNPFANLMSEILGTFILAFGLLLIGENEFTEGLKPMVVGLLIIGIGLCLGGTTGFAINPARDLGPRIAHAILPIHGKGSSDWGYAWIPVAGPIIGGLVAVLVFGMLG